MISIIEDNNIKSFKDVDLYELDILSRLYHPNIVHKINITQSSDPNIAINHIYDLPHYSHRNIVELPLIDQTLVNLFYNKFLTTKMKLPILYKIAHALNFLHKNNIVHGNLLMENVLISGFQNYEPYLSNFDVSNRLNKSDDILAFGLLALKLISTNDDDNLLIALSGTSIEYHDKCLDLFVKTFDSSNCPYMTMEDVIQHPLFDHFRIEIETYVNELDDYNYAEDHRDILKLLIHWIKNIYSNVDVELLFLAIDLFNRTDSLYQDINERMYVAVVAIYIASKFVLKNNFRNDDLVNKLLTELPELTIEIILLKEREIIKLLDGVLNISKLYKSCNNVDQLMLTFNHIIMNYDSTTYYKVNIDEWISTMELYIGCPKRNDKHITIEEFFS